MFSMPSSYFQKKIIKKKTTLKLIIQERIAWDERNPWFILKLRILFNKEGYGKITN